MSRLRSPFAGPLRAAWSRRTSRRGADFRARLLVVALEGRVAPANFMVTNVNDSGSGSLRQAILSANSQSGFDGIVFDSNFFSTPRTISLTSGELLISDTLGITGPGLLTVRRDPAAATNFRIFDVTASGIFGVTISALTISGGMAPTDGGGVRVAPGQSVTIQVAVISGNSAASPGGGLSVGNGGSLTVRNTTISGNTAGTDSASINRAGGGIAVLGGTLLVENSTVSGNQAATEGGGLYFYGGTPAVNETVRNCTISGNTAGTSGGGVQVRAGGAGVAVLVQNCTVAINTANGTAAGLGGGGIAVVGAGASATITSTVVANNTNAPDALGSISATFSLVRDQTGATLAGGNNLPAGTDPLFFAAGLVNNGGSTQTIELHLTSPLVDKGSNPASLIYDQRGNGFPRVVGAAADIGAFEVQPPAQVSSVVVNAGQANLLQRSMVTWVTITFSRLISFTGSTPFQLTRTGPGAPTGNVTLIVDLSGSTATQSVAQLRFLGPLTAGANSLVDGNFTLTVVSDQIRGGIQGGDNVSSLHRLFGDVNGDKAVNGLDLTAFRNAFGTVAADAGYNSILDFNGDRAINGTDLTQFRNRFGVILP